VAAMNSQTAVAVSSIACFEVSALTVNSAKAPAVGCGEQSEPHQTRRAEAMRFVPHRILRRCRVGSGRGYDRVLGRRIRFGSGQPGTAAFRPAIRNSYTAL
jgi:hypothetical protein